jgi:hypothetical protein
MRLTISLTVLSLILSSCATSSSAPDAEECALYSHGKPDDWGLVCESIQSKKARFIPVEHANGFICFDPDEYEKMRTWFKGVE